MRNISLAYRDHDRTPVIYCIKAMAERHYGVAVEVVQIEDKRHSKQRYSKDTATSLSNISNISIPKRPRAGKSRCSARRRFNAV